MKLRKMTNYKKGKKKRRRRRKKKLKLLDPEYRKK